MLRDGHHLLLRVLNLIFFDCLMVCDRLHVNITVLLRCSHTLFLKLIHCALCCLVLFLHHFLKDLLVCNWSQRNLMIDGIVVLLLMREHDIDSNVLIVEMGKL